MNGTVPDGPLYPVKPKSCQGRRTVLTQSSPLSPLSSCKRERPFTSPYSSNRSGSPLDNARELPGFPKSRVPILYVPKKDIYRECKGPLLLPQDDPLTQLRRNSLGFRPKNDEQPTSNSHYHEKSVLYPQSDGLSCFRATVPNPPSYTSYYEPSLKQKEKSGFYQAATFPSKLNVNSSSELCTSEEELCDKLMMEMYGFKKPKRKLLRNRSCSSPSRDYCNNQNVNFYQVKPYMYTIVNDDPPLYRDVTFKSPKQLPAHERYITNCVSPKTVKQLNSKPVRKLTKSSTSHSTTDTKPKKNYEIYYESYVAPRGKGKNTITVPKRNVMKEPIPEAPGEEIFLREEDLVTEKCKGTQTIIKSSVCTETEGGDIKVEDFCGAASVCKKVDTRRLNCLNADVTVIIDRGSKEDIYTVLDGGTGGTLAEAKGDIKPTSVDLANKRCLRRKAKKLETASKPQTPKGILKSPGGSPSTSYRSKKL